MNSVLTSSTLMNSGLTVGTSAPVDNLGLVDLEAVVFLNVKARRISNGTVDVEDQTTASADEMMVVVANTVLITSRRASGLNPTDETLVGEGAERVIDRLSGDRADLVAYDSVSSSAVACGLSVTASMMARRCAVT